MADLHRSVKADLRRIFKRLYFVERIATACYFVQSVYIVSVSVILYRALQIAKQMHKTRPNWSLGGPNCQFRTLEGEKIKYM